MCERGNVISWSFPTYLNPGLCKPQPQSYFFSSVDIRVMCLLESLLQLFSLVQSELCAASARLPGEGIVLSYIFRTTASSSPGLFWHTMDRLWVLEKNRGLDLISGSAAFVFFVLFSFLFFFRLWVYYILMYLCASFESRHSLWRRGMRA